MEREKSGVVALGHGAVGGCREHEAPRRVMLLDGAPRMGAHLNGEHIANIEFRTKPDEDGGDAARIRLGQFGEIAGSHHHLGALETASCFDITGQGFGEPEMDRVEDGIDDKGHPAPLGLLGGADKGIEIAVRRRHQDWRGARALRDIKRTFLEA
jgi:hypothetical protein